MPQSVVMDIIGHESRAVSQVYTHVGEAEKRQAMAALPSRSTLLQANDLRKANERKTKHEKADTKMQIKTSISLDAKVALKT